MNYLYIHKNKRQFKFITKTDALNFFIILD